MLRTNLSTRPFYNERAVHLCLGLGAALVCAVTAFNLWQIYSLTGRDARVRSSIQEAESRARELRSAAARTRSAINPREIEEVSAAAREANLVIDRRLFSWTELFNRFENTLPDDVRVSAVRPSVEREGSMRVLIVVVAKDARGVNAFIENLEKDGSFAGLICREEFLDEGGQLKATIEGRYLASPGSRSAKP
jgi:Tfp pilus assembly protein PilN